jgi:ATP-dependent Lon protease
VILPKRNEGDLDDVPEAVREEMTFHIAEEVGDVLAVALEGVPAPAARAPAA